MYVIQHYFICRPSGSTVSEDAGIEPRTVATLALTARRSNHSVRSHPPVRLDLIHTQLNLIHQNCKHIILGELWLSDCWCNAAIVKGSIPECYDIQHNTENSKQIFPEKELRGLSPISAFMCLWEIYIFPCSVCLFCNRKICGPILGIYKSLTDTWMWKLGLRPRNSFSGNT